MTVIRLDAATLARVQNATGPVFLADESGTPILKCAVSPVHELDREPDLTAEEWEAIENDPVEYSLAEVWDRIRRGATP